MTPQGKMEVMLHHPLACSLVLVILLPLSSHAFSIRAPQAPEFFNITTLSTYTFTSPEQNEGAASPQVAASGVVGDASGRPMARANDSSAQASDQDSRSFPVAQQGRHPANILGKPSGEGHWATPAPHSAIALPFVPLKLYSQVRHTYEVNHKPRSDAIASASTPAELAAAARLRESIQTKKISEVYSEEGYEDTAYDHAGFKKDAGFSEGHEGHEGGRKKTGKIGEGGAGGYGEGISGSASTSEDQKYPFHKIPSSDAVPLHSPLRYALNPVSGSIPSKTKGGTEFYDSTDTVECPAVVELPSIPGRAFRRPPEDNEEGESAEKGEDSEGEESREPKLAPTPPPPPTPRLKGLGDKIDCLRTKFFGGEEPLDNPFFKEEVVKVAKNEIRKAKAEQSRIKEEIEKDKVKGEESKRNEKIQSEEQETKVQPHRREKSRRGYAAGFESYNPTAAANNSGEKRNTSVPASARPAPAVVETIGEDRIGEETDDSATGGVGAAVEGLPSAAASDSDMAGFYADIMGHIQSATGNIVRQAYSSRNNGDSEGRVRRVRPPKAPRPPITEFVDEREPFPASQYPSVLPAPSNYEESDNRYAVEEDVDEGEEYAGSERDEEEEEDEGDHHHHHHHSHPSFLGGAQKIILRPINPQPQRYTSGGTGTEAPFRPSPLLYVQTHPAPQRIIGPTHTHSSHHSSADSHMHHHHHQHPYSSEPHSHHYHSKTGIRTFLVPAGKRPVPLSPPPIGHHYHINTISGLRGSGTLLIPTSTRHASTTPIYPSITLYPSRSPFNSLKRQSPVGQEFDGLLTATTQSVTILATPPSNFVKYRGQQPIADMVAASSSVSKSFAPPKNIEYFTLKDSLPRNKNPSVASTLLPPESETLIPQITFTTTEKYLDLEQYNLGSNVAPLPPVEANADNMEVSKTYGSANIESATQETLHSESELTESSLTRQAIPTARSDSKLEAAVLSTMATKLVTEEVAKGVVRAAIEEGTKKRRKNLRFTKINDSATADFTVTSTQTPRNRRRKNRIGLRNTYDEGGDVTSAGTHVDAGSIRWDKKSQQGGVTEDTNKAMGRTINNRGNRMRKGERGSSRTRVGLTEMNGRRQGIRGHKRGEPGYNTPSDEDTNIPTKITVATDTWEEHTKSDKMKRSTAHIQQRAERRTGIISKESLTPHESSEVSSESNGSTRFRDQSSLQTDRPLKEIIPSISEDIEDAKNQKPSEHIEEPRKMFIEPRIRGDRRKVQIPRKVVTRSRTQHRIRVTTDIKDDIKNTGVINPEGRQKRIESVSTDPAVKRWEAGKRRILTSLEEVGEDRSRGRQRENERKSPHTGSISNRSTTGKVDNRNNPNNQRVLRHREVKETLTSVYAPEE